MQELTIKIMDERKLNFLLELLSQLDFIELDNKFFKEQKPDASYDFFNSAGLFNNRDINAKQMRKKAWRR
jgi:hypothetical protein